MDMNIVDNQFSKEFWRTVFREKGYIPRNADDFVFTEYETGDINGVIYETLINLGHAREAHELYDLDDDAFDDVMYWIGRKCAEAFKADIDGHEEYIFSPREKDGSKKHALRRKRNVKKALRKRNISRTVYWDGLDWYDNLHEYSKNKVHCSCPMCSEKTNKKAFRGKGFGSRSKREHPMWEKEPVNMVIDGETVCIIPGVPNTNGSTFGETNHRNHKNWSISDRKKIEKMDSIETEWETT